MVNQYIFWTVLGLSSSALILAIYHSSDSITGEVHSFALISRASLSLAVGFLWYILINLDCFFKDSLIDLSIHFGDS